MKSIKSERLKKIEQELHDLEEWLKLGLVPKKDINKHNDEIRVLKSKLEEEKERIKNLREGEGGEAFVMPKRAPAKGAYNEMPTIPDVDFNESNSGLTDSGFEMSSYASEETSAGEDNAEEYYTAAEHTESGAKQKPEADRHNSEEEDESYFSEKNRWKRGGIVDPDADEW